MNYNRTFDFIVDILIIIIILMTLLKPSCAHESKVTNCQYKVKQ